MIEVECVQGTDEWRRARLGVVTASELDRILTPKKLGLSSQAEGYLNHLVAERVLGEVIESEHDRIAAARRGTDMEAEAVEWYEFTTGLQTRAVGFCLTDDRRVGCSPDRLVGEDGGLEVKCPLAVTQVGYVANPDSLVAAYHSQVQGGLWVTGRKHWDILAFHPSIAPVLVRVTRDEKYLDALTRTLAQFHALMDERLRALGVAA